MSNLRPFQIVLLAVFAAMGIGALVMLGAYQASVSQQAKLYGDRVIIWGTFPQRAVNPVLGLISKTDKAFGVVEYYQLDKDTFSDDLVNAIAEGRGPDLITLSSDDIVTLQPKLLPIPYDTLPQRTYRDTYVDGAEIFTFPEGVYALPVAVDPLMLYWNRDLFAASGLAQAPRTWEEMVNLVVPNLTIVDNRRTILQSALAFGEYRNLENAKAKLIMLAIQTGSKLVYLTTNGYRVELDQHVVPGTNTLPLQAALEFFTDFSNANSPLYSWNRSQQSDKNAFLAGELATYFGFASEYGDIVDKNPNLNFDVAPVPQGSAATIKRTYGTFYGFAIPQSAGNQQGAYLAASTLTSADSAALLAEAFAMAPARRDIIAAGADDPAMQAAMTAALIARGWLDPAPVNSDSIFAEMVESIVSNRQRIEAAVSIATSRLVREF